MNQRRAGMSFSRHLLAFDVDGHERSDEIGAVRVGACDENGAFDEGGFGFFLLPQEDGVGLGVFALGKAVKAGQNGRIEAVFGLVRLGIAGRTRGCFAI